MSTLHLRAASGPRAVSAGTVRGLLASGALRRDQRAVSLDGGLTWIGADEALAAIALGAVPDAAVDAASAESGDGLHPIAVPLGALAVAALATALAFGSGPKVDLSSVPSQACAGGTAVVSGARDAAGAVVDCAAGIIGGGWALVSGPSGQAPRVGEAASADGVAPAKPAIQPATAEAGDLLASWRDFLKQGADSARDVWAARAEALGQQSVRLGISSWPVRLSAALPVADADQGRIASVYTGTKKPLCEAILDLPGADAMAIGGVVEDATLAKRLQAMKVGSELKVSATCLAVKCDPEKRTVDLIVVITAAE